MITQIPIPDLIQLATESYGRMLAARVEGDYTLERLCQCNMAAAEVMLNGQLINGRKGPIRAGRRRLESNKAANLAKPPKGK